MKLIRTLALFLLTALLLAACGKDEAENQQTAVVSGQNSLLALVPADTPYLGGNLAPVPDAIIDSYLTRFEPALVSLQAELSKAKMELESNPEELADDPAQRVVHALLQEVDGKLNRAGLESLGFDLSAVQVIHGISAFPVMRSSLSDASALRATVQRVLDNADIEAPELEFQGQAYWRIVPDLHNNDAYDLDSDADYTDSDDEAKMAIYVAILQDHLALGMLPIAAESTVLPAFLGQEKPANSVAAARLAEINQRFNFTPYGTGVLDLQKFVDELLNPESLAGQLLTSEGSDLARANTDQCRAEISSIIAHTPFIYSGVTALSETVAANQVVIETESSIASELIQLVSDVPVANAATSYLAELALGLKVGPLRDFLRSKAMAVVEQPYQCEFLLEMNGHAQSAADQLNQPLPPMVNNLLGLRVAISRMGGQSSPESVEGMIALHVTQPEMLVGMAQMLLPNLADLNLAAGEPPVQVPPDMIPLPGMVLYAAQSKSAIGLSVGAGEQDALADFINQKAKATGTFLSANYDTATYLDITNQFSEEAMAARGHSSGGGFAETAQSVYKSVADRSDTRVSFSKDGLTIDSKMTFKNP